MEHHTQKKVSPFTFAVALFVLIGILVTVKFIITSTPDAQVDEPMFYTQVANWKSASTRIGVEQLRFYEGYAFLASAIDEDLDTDEELSITFKTPAATAATIYAIPEASASGISIMKVLESPTVTVDSGVQLVAVNRNRASSNTSLVSSAETTPTVGSVSISITATATTVLEQFTMSSITRDTAGESSGSIYVLSPNTYYTFVVIAKTDNERASIKVKWYEEIP